jgi:hyperosmotically inducible protein
MRAAFVCLFAVALLGCGRIDTGNKPVATPTAPTITVPENAARPSATAADTGSPTDESRRDASRDRAKPPEANAEPDNTAVNARDTNRQTREPKLPIDQKETQHDVDLTAKIRQRVLASEGMSVNARNVKIITADGQVTLRGPVDSTAERDTIARIAREVAGDGNVVDQIEVKASNSASNSPNP